MNMGNYAHGNQPIQHMIYLYNYAGQPWKAQYWLRETMNRLYLPTPDGYCGDEDNGQTSAGMCSPHWILPRLPRKRPVRARCPLLQEGDAATGNGQKLEISAPKNSDENRYIRSLNYNGKNYTKNYLDHFELLRGGKLTFNMDSRPNKTRGVKESDFPYSLSNE